MELVSPTDPASIPAFEDFGHIYRVSRECIITEKIDGTNASILIPDFGEFKDDQGNTFPFLVGSRNKWIFPNNDNYGFATWAYGNRDEVLKLGPGRHFGEWWGAGIQRRYGVKEKRFSLFNTSRWEGGLPSPIFSLVPILYKGIFETAAVDAALADLQAGGSVAAPGFMDPEGVVIYHTASRSLFKKTLKGDGHKFQNQTS